MPKLVIVCGLPGSGKTTKSKLLENQIGAIRMSPDEWMIALDIDIYDEGKRGHIESLQWDLAQRLLRLGTNVIIEWGTWGRSERDSLRSGARKLGAEVDLHYLHASPEVLFDRISFRGLEDPPIQFSDVVRWSNSFQVPTAEELSLFDNTEVTRS